MTPLAGSLTMSPQPETQSSGPLPFEDAARLPLPGDNVAIATRTLPAGTQIDYIARRCWAAF